MSSSRYCVNTACSCPVRDTGDACCEDCQNDAAGHLPGACACGHNECEPRGLEVDSEVADVAMV